MAARRTPIPAALFGRILQAAATTTGCAHFGLLHGEAAALENVGELRFLLLNAKTVRQAFDHLVRFATLMHQPLKVRVGRAPGYATLAIGLAQGAPDAEQVLLGYLASVVKALRTIVAARWNPSLVHLAIRRPKSIEPYRRFFRAPVLFDQPEFATVLPDAILDAPRAAGDPQLAEFIFERLCALEAQAPRDLVEKVRHAIETELLRGECDVVRVAGMFSVHRKTLHGYLQEFGTSFEELLDETRNGLAVRMLEHTDLPIGEIAAALRYSNQAGLTREFRRWHGRSPSQWRKDVVGRLAVKRAAGRYKAAAPRHKA